MSGFVAATYDPLGRMNVITSGANYTKFDYDGNALISEYSFSNALLRRYVHGPGTDEPLVWYEYDGTGAASRRWFHADERGSVVAVSDSSANAAGTFAYDEYGRSQGGAFLRFRYTGQAWLTELDMYYYRARMYSPSLGRFMQTDPIGYGDGMNMYAYVGNDPINNIDPRGTDIEVVGRRVRINDHRGEALAGLERIATQLTMREITRNPERQSERNNVAKSDDCSSSNQEDCNIIITTDPIQYAGTCPQGDVNCNVRWPYTLEGVYVGLGRGLERNAEYLMNCLEGLGSVNVREVASEAGRAGRNGFVSGALRGGGAVIEAGPEAVLAGAAGGAATGSATGVARGGIQSIVRQSCAAGNPR